MKEIEQNKTKRASLFTIKRIQGQIPSQVKLELKDYPCSLLTFQLLKCPFLSGFGPVRTCSGGGTQASKVSGDNLDCYKCSINKVQLN